MYEKDMKKVDFSVTVTPEDIYSFQKENLKKVFSPISIIVFSIILISIVFSIIISLLDTGKPPIGGIVFLAIIMGVVILVPIQLKIVSRNAFKNNKLLQKTQNYQIDEEIVHIFTESSDTKIRWDELYKAIETKNSILLYLSAQQAYTIPKRIFAKEQDKLQVLREFIKNAPKPKEKKFTFFKFGCLFYVVLFFIVLIVLMIYSAK